MLKIIQITDCHLLQDQDALLQGCNTDKSFAHILNKAVACRPDYLILTGDLSEDGSLSSYQRMHAALLATGLKFFVLPGNHDHIEHIQKIFQDRLMLDCSVLIEGWRLIFLNSVLPGMHYGFLADASLQFLRSELTQSDTRPTAIFVHHHPVDTGNAFINRYNIHNAAAFLEILSCSLHLKFVAFGHIHHALSVMMAGVSFFGAPSSCFQFRGDIDGVVIDPAVGSGYRIFELADDGGFNTWVEGV